MSADLDVPVPYWPALYPQVRAEAADAVQFWPTPAARCPACRTGTRGGVVTPAEAIQAAELAEAETRYRNQVGRLMYEAGRREAEAEMAARWDEIARAAIHGPDHAELEECRWGPGGRAHFADARPGDFPGRAQREAEPELEAG
jgi:hypothetical protein